MFLTQGVTSKYPMYHDPRCHTIEAAVYFAQSLGILVVIYFKFSFSSASFSSPFPVFMTGFQTFFFSLWFPHLPHHLVSFHIHRSPLFSPFYSPPPPPFSSPRHGYHHITTESFTQMICFYVRIFKKEITCDLYIGLRSSQIFIIWLLFGSSSSGSSSTFRVVIYFVLLRPFVSPFKTTEIVFIFYFFGFFMDFLKIFF